MNFWQFNGVAGFLTRDVSVLMRGDTVIMAGKDNNREGEEIRDQSGKSRPCDSGLILTQGNFRLSRVHESF